MRSRLLKIFIYLIAVIICYFIIQYFVVKHDKHSNVKLSCRYMAYACGDCNAKYKIVKVEKSDYYKAGDLEEKDLKVEFVTKDMESRLDSLVGKCAICYNFIFEGKLSRSEWSDFFVLKVEKYQISLPDSSCCD